MSIKRRIVISLFLASLPTTALADPKKEAQDAMSWGLNYCKDALNAIANIEKPNASAADQIEGLYEKFKARLATATAADSSIRTWNGTLRGMKVNEGIAKCEKELPAYITSARAAGATEDRDRALINGCRAASNPAAQASAWPDFQQQKAEALKANKGPFTGKLKEELDKCEANHAAMVKATDEQNKEFADARAKREAEAAEQAKKEAEEERKFRATLKGDRARYYDKFGLPKFDGPDIMKASEWHWIHDKTSQFGVTKPCFTYVKFNGNTKVKEWKSGDSCKW